MVILVILPLSPCEENIYFIYYKKSGGHIEHIEWHMNEGKDLMANVPKYWHDFGWKFVEGFH